MKAANKFLVDLRVALVQLNPQIGRVHETTARARSLLNQYKAALDKKKDNHPPDLIVFPEFALTGYNFTSREHILPYTSKTEQSDSFKFAQDVAKQFHCYTVIGYPESETETKETLYNSAVVVSPAGEMVFNYRKSFLYFTEDNWGCKENPKQFQNFPLTFKKRATRIGDKSDERHDITLKASIGICMDLSPYKFEAPFNDFEFSSYNVDNNIELIICPMAWLHSTSITKQDTDMDEKGSSEIPKKLAAIAQNLQNQNLPLTGSEGDFQIDLDQANITTRLSKSSPDINHEYTELSKPDMTNVNYWMLRFLPFLHLNVRYYWWQEKVLTDVFSELKRKTYMGASSTKAWEFSGKNAVLLLTNRCGVEDGNTLFAGSSGIYKFNGKEDFSREELQKDDNSRLDSTNPSVELYGNLGKGKEGIIMRDITFEVER